MTTPILPEFILSLFENEIKNIIQKTLTIVSNKYDINVKELQSVVEKEMRFKLELDSTEDIIIIKKRQNLPETNERCIARIKKNGILLQCTRKSKHDDKCGFHCKPQQTKKYGTIKDDLPEEPISKRKMNIY